MANHTVSSTVGLAPSTPLQEPGAAGVGSRLDTLDGMRGLAALLVVVYHLFARHAEPIVEQTLYPHGNLLSYAPWLSVFGDLGILIFFVISGFVIMLTLERSSGILDFIGRRIARLWPAMLVCATLSTLVLNLGGAPEFYSRIVPEAINWRVTPLEYISSIFFFPPNLASNLLNLNADSPFWIEGVYWTLWHEVRFYALISLVFLVSPRALFLWAWAGIQAFSTYLEAGGVAHENPYFMGFWITVAFQPRFLAWFSLGLCIYMLWARRFGPVLIVIAALAAIAIVADEIVIMQDGHLLLAPRAAALGITYLFILLPFFLFLKYNQTLGILRSRFFVTVGLASYPLYLFHELPGLSGMMLGVKLGVPPIPAALLTMAALIGIAILIHHVVELPAKSLITKAWRRFVTPLQDRVRWLRY